jgi:hypothetical protein
MRRLRYRQNIGLAGRRVRLERLPARHQLVRQAIASWGVSQIPLHEERPRSPTTGDQFALRCYSDRREELLASRKGLGENRRLLKTLYDGLHKSGSNASIAGVWIDTELGDICNERFVAEYSHHSEQAAVGLHCGKCGKHIRTIQEALSEIINR